MKLEDALTKKELSEGLKKREIFHGYELFDDSVSPTIQLNLGVPAYLIKSISQFVNKESTKLVVKDAVLFYSAIHQMFPEGNIGDEEAKKIKQKYDLSFFGGFQYKLLNYFIKHFDN